MGTSVLGPPDARGLVLDDDRHCFGCGELNSIGLKLRFTKIEDGVQTFFTAGKNHQGYKNLLHGGLMSLVLDEAMVNAAWLNEAPAVSVEIRVRLRRAVTVGETLKVHAWITGSQKRLVLTRAEARDGSGRLVAEADAKCIRTRVMHQNKVSGR